MTENNGLLKKKRSDTKDEQAFLSIHSQKKKDFIDH